MKAGFDTLNKSVNGGVVKTPWFTRVLNFVGLGSSSSSAPNPMGLNPGNGDERMYLEYWKLQRNPFDDVPDPLMYCEGHESVENAVAELLFAIEEANDSLAVIVGEAGVGKTMTLRLVANLLSPDKYRIALVTNPEVNFNQLMREIIGQLRGEPCQIWAKEFLLEEFGRLLAETLETGQKVVVLVDEASSMQPPDLESLRLLTNIDKDNCVPFTFVLSGQPKLAGLLEAADQAAVFQRVGIYLKLKPLSSGQLVRDYVEGRMERAGCDQKVFSDEALTAIYEHSNGTPRLINRICKLALKAAQTNRLSIVEVDLVKAIAHGFEAGDSSNGDKWEAPEAPEVLAESPETAQSAEAPESESGLSEEDTAPGPGEMQESDVPVSLDEASRYWPASDSDPSPSTLPDSLAWESACDYNPFRKKSPDHELNESFMEKDGEPRVEPTDPQELQGAEISDREPPVWDWQDGRGAFGPEDAAPEGWQETAPSSWDSLSTEEDHAPSFTDREWFDANPDMTPALSDSFAGVDMREGPTAPEGFESLEATAPVPLEGSSEDRDPAELLAWEEAPVESLAETGPSPWDGLSGEQPEEPPFADLEWLDGNVQSTTAVSTDATPGDTADVGVAASAESEVPSYTEATQPDEWGAHDDPATEMLTTLEEACIEDREESETRSVGVTLDELSQQADGTVDGENRELAETVTGSAAIGEAEGAELPLSTFELPQEAQTASLASDSWDTGPSEPPAGLSEDVFTSGGDHAEQLVDEFKLAESLSPAMEPAPEASASDTTGLTNGELLESREDNTLSEALPVDWPAAEDGQLPNSEQTGSRGGQETSDSGWSFDQHPSTQMSESDIAVPQPAYETAFDAKIDVSTVFETSDNDLPPVEPLEYHGSGAAEGVAATDTVESTATTQPGQAPETPPKAPLLPPDQPVELAPEVLEELLRVEDRRSRLRLAGIVAAKHLDGHPELLKGHQIDPVQLWDELRFRIMTQVQEKKLADTIDH